jgi:hypothetical protein
MDKGEIILYQPDNSIELEVRIEAETVWLTQAQMALLFGCSTDNVGLHLKNIYDEHEIDPISTAEEISVVRKEGKRMVARRVRHYNLDAILSVGYRVSSANATKFRQWANKVLKDYLLRGYAINQRFEQLEQRVSRTEEKIELFVRTSLPPMEGVFYEGQIFDAHVFASNLIKSAKSSIVLIDNYVDESVLTTLSKRENNVSAKIVTKSISDQFQLDLNRHNSQYPQIEVEERTDIHDRFLIIDDTVYHIGASLKDLGKKLFAFSKLGISPEIIQNDSQSGKQHSNAKTKN